MSSPGLALFFLRNCYLLRLKVLKPLSKLTKELLISNPIKAKKIYLHGLLPYYEADASELSLYIASGGKD